MFKVSIYISTCNRLPKLKRAVTSVLNQTYKNWELLICDDASTDGTQQYALELCEKYDNILYFRNEVNKGACATRNLGIFNATGKFITGLDDDDEFTDERISFFVDNWNDKYSFICTNVLERSPLLKPSPLYKNLLRRTIIFSYKDLLITNTASNQVFTKLVRLKKIGGFNKDIKKLQDWDVWLRLSYKYGKFKRFNKCTYIMHHDHTENEKRVSKNEKTYLALFKLARYNPGLYNSKDRKHILYIYKTVIKKETSFIGGVFLTLKTRNLFFINLWVRTKLKKYIKRA